MTFCIGIHVRDGIVALADTQIVKGDEVSSKAKLSITHHDGHPLLLMTSGLRSIRDKAALRLDDELAELTLRATPHQRLHRVVSSYGDQIKHVRTEDGESMAASGLTFNSHAIIGGRLTLDDEPGMFLVYPEGNWITATPDAPYFIIGRSAYGKPILDRLLHFDTPLPQAITLAYLAFDATRASVVDVDFPIDVVLLEAGGRMHQRRFDRRELGDVHDLWQERLRATLEEIPTDWAASLWTDETEVA